MRDKNHKRPNVRKPKNLGPTDAAKSASGSMIYGLLPVIEALRAQNRSVEKVYIVEGSREKRLSEVFALCRARSIAWNYVSRANFSKYFEPDVNHQGIAAVVASANYVAADDLLLGAGPVPLLLILDGVEDPRNLGAILRVADCSAVDGVFIPERRAVGLNDTVAKASAGAIEYVKVAKVPNLNRLIAELKERDVWVVGTSIDADTGYTDWDWTRPSALVLGGEGGGLHRLVAENCDALVKIPMYGKIDSLNVSVAAGVILFEARKQRAAVQK